jgi:hypothetical protein
MWRGSHADDRRYRTLVLADVGCHWQWASHSSRLECQFPVTGCGSQPQYCHCGRIHGHVVGSDFRHRPPSRLGATGSNVGRYRPRSDRSWLSLIVLQQQAFSLEHGILKKEPEGLWRTPWKERPTVTGKRLGQHRSCITSTFTFRTKGSSVGLELA